MNLAVSPLRRRSRGGRARGARGGGGLAGAVRPEVKPILRSDVSNAMGWRSRRAGCARPEEGCRRGDSEEPAVVPGKSADSPLIKFVTSKDPTRRCREGRAAWPEQIAALRRWIDLGAHWPASTAAGASEAPAEVRGRSAKGSRGLGVSKSASERTGDRGRGELGAQPPIASSSRAARARLEPSSEAPRRCSFGG